MGQTSILKVLLVCEGHSLGGWSRGSLSILLVLITPKCIVARDCTEATALGGDGDGTVAVAEAWR